VDGDSLGLELGFAEGDSLGLVEGDSLGQTDGDSLPETSHKVGVGFTKNKPPSIELTATSPEEKYGYTDHAPLNLFS